MKNEMKERVAFLASSLLKLTDMTTKSLKEAVNMVGIDVIEEHLGLGQPYYLTDFETMAEEICFYVGLEPICPISGQTDEELTRMGLQIADLVEDASPAYEDVAESLAAVLGWCGLEAWLEINNR